MKSFGSKLLLALFLMGYSLLKAQEIPIKYTMGEDYGDRYKYSTVLNISDAGTQGTVLVRKYYGGMVLKPKGYFIEVYDKDLKLVADHNYKYSGKHMIDGFVKDGQLYLLELIYSERQKAYVYRVHQSALKDFGFSIKDLFSTPSKEVINPLAISKYSRNFTQGFSTAVFFDDAKSAFAITVHHRKGKKQVYDMYLYGTDLQRRVHYDFTAQIEEKNYAFETITIAPDQQSFYLMGKAYFKKRRVDAKERRFQYELVRISNAGHQIQEFKEPGRFPESLKPILMEDQLVVVGFYADRKDNRYNGLSYFKLHPNTLLIQDKKFNAFSKAFMLDKFGREDDRVVKNLIFKDVHVTPSKEILFSAEEYFMTEGVDRSSAGTNLKTQRYHYNDIICAKLDAEGNMQWARNINKTEVTRGDASYASYTAYGKESDMYFFINSGENPKKLSKNRILFKQGYSRSPNMFVLKLDAEGNLSYQKLIDDKEARLPIMVSRPLIDTTSDEILFYAKRGNKKQLLKVAVDASR